MNSQHPVEDKESETKEEDKRSLNLVEDRGPTGQYGRSGADRCRQHVLPVGGPVDPQPTAAVLLHGDRGAGVRLDGSTHWHAGMWKVGHQ